MQRVSLIFLAAAGLVLALGDAAAAQDFRRAERLVGANENPPVVSDGTGRFRSQLFPDRVDFTLTYDVAGVGSDVTQAHLHIANPSNNGGIVVFLCSNAGNTPAGATQRDCPPSPARSSARSSLTTWSRSPRRHPDHRGRRLRGPRAADEAGRDLRQRSQR